MCLPVFLSSSCSEEIGLCRRGEGGVGGTVVVGDSVGVVHLRRIHDSRASDAVSTYCRQEELCPDDPEMAMKNQDTYTPHMSVSKEIEQGRRGGGHVAGDDVQITGSVVREWQIAMPKPCQF